MACFSCLVPPAFGSILAAKALATVGAVKGAALLGVGALAAKKALVAKGAAVVAAKHAALKSVGAAVLGAKALALKGAVAKGAALLAAKGAAISGAVALGAKALSAGSALAREVARPAYVRYLPYVSWFCTEFFFGMTDVMDDLPNLVRTYLDTYTMLG